MSTVKISELTALTSADAADELVIVDDSAGVTKKITHANLANFGTRTVTAGAIDFSGLANAAGMTSEVLDDYEEGTFTPTIRGSSTAGTGTYTHQYGKYIKIGSLVHYHIRLTYTALSGATGTHLQAGDLPFRVSSNATWHYYMTGGVYYQNLNTPNTADDIIAYALPNTFNLQLVGLVDDSSVAAVLIDTAADLFFTGVYHTS